MDKDLEVFPSCFRALLVLSDCSKQTETPPTPQVPFSVRHCSMRVCNDCTAEPSRHDVQCASIHYIHPMCTALRQESPYENQLSVGRVLFCLSSAEYTIDSSVGWNLYPDVGLLGGRCRVCTEQHLCFAQRIIRLAVAA